MITFLSVLWIILLIQLVFAAIAIVLKTDKVTDLSYGLTFVICVRWLFLNHGDSLLDFNLLILISLRWVRLAGYLFLRIMAIGKDKRFDRIREKPGSFVKFWILQAAIIILLLLPTVVVMPKDGVGFSLVSMVWVLVVLWGLLIESVADWQKYSFKRQNPTHWVNTWLWKKARHPNYFGEMLVRWGLFLVCLPVLSWWEYLTVISPLALTRILLFITWIPPLEKQREKKYGDQKEFQDWKESTNVLFPL